MNKNKIKKILDKTDIYVLDEINILEYIDELEARIDEAIEYIERNCLEFNVKYACNGLNNDKVDVLLDILRGEDNDN